MTIPGIPATILVAPDSFKGTFSAAEVAAAIGAGLGSAGRAVDLCPVADGGEGTLTGLIEPLGGETLETTVEDPLGRPVRARFGLIGRGDAGEAAAGGRGRGGRPGGRGGRGRGGTRGSPEVRAVVEMASASGLGLVAERERDAESASTFGTGELIVAAVQAGAELVYLGAGGSASTDGGAGAIRAIREAGGLRGARLVVLCDVRTPFEDAARVFAAQKGADPDAVARLTRRLRSLARGLERDPRGMPMTGAAGGLAGGLWAAFGAELVPGAAFVLDQIGFDRRLHRARAVVTGEGRLDGQSLAGKAVSEVATRARQSGVPCFAIVGERDLDAFGARVLDLQGVLEASTLAEIEAAGGALAGLI